MIDIIRVLQLITEINPDSILDDFRLIEIEHYINTYSNNSYTNNSHTSFSKTTIDYTDKYSETHYTMSIMDFKQNYLYEIENFFFAHT